MKSLEKIINTYILGLHQFNLDDDIECYGLVRNFKASFQSLIVSQNFDQKNIFFHQLKKAYLQPNTEDVINGLLEIKESKKG
ncbi:hypothetical protein [Kordia jejudonensis]|uniref:hypothetical protein n=1 Tax=Kordia jejudonensis TaxID=1348245 RepID=UPI0006295266|nr:hypothetical protein [Kordia jejudonensis]